MGRLDAVGRVGKCASGGRRDMASEKAVGANCCANRQGDVNTSDKVGDHPSGEACATEARAFSPTFVVGCERSGTTLLAVLIGRHSQVAMTPETHFFLRTVPKRHPDRAGDHAEMVDRFFKSPRAEDLGLGRDEVLARFAAGPPTYP